MRVHAQTCKLVRWHAYIHECFEVIYSLDCPEKLCITTKDFICYENKFTTTERRREEEREKRRKLYEKLNKKEKSQQNSKQPEGTFGEQ